MHKTFQVELQKNLCPKTYIKFFFLKDSVNRLNKSGFLKSGPWPPLGITEPFSGSHKQRPSLSSFSKPSIVLQNPSVTILINKYSLVELKLVVVIITS